MVAIMVDEYKMKNIIKLRLPAVAQTGNIHEQ